ncbi:unnamed protein product [Rotaria magnacalcarata]|uniref:Myb/SANT-like DNA-binding domain-containing protein n=4 Tax=Rotaria TaxID=231623 RepID=A0A816NXX8_9BILA|nr:unnamed protein product [Rotaria magnacalcarata]CAF2041817.1 unnamed protein product [Rotaria magnacalcarata]CAF4287559.1 unnamed protein product [Rotaria magnacalcarata]CAF4292282.1 unnamed protein product [Rotaria magnacalcarata]
MQAFVYDENILTENENNINVHANDQQSHSHKDDTFQEKEHVVLTGDDFERSKGKFIFRMRRQQQMNFLLYIYTIIIVKNGWLLLSPPNKHLGESIRKLLLFTMKPQYVRFVMSPNNNVQFNVQPQNSHYLKLNSVHKVLHQNNVVSSLQILNGINPPATATLPTRLIINSSPKTFTLSSPITPQTINKSTAGITILEQVPNSSSVVDIPIARSTTAESPLSAETLMSPVTTMTKSKSTAANKNTKNELVYLESTPRATKKTDKKIKHLETTPKAAKRSRNWSQGETLSFIRIWSDFQLQLNKGGQRNTSIYNQMAKELNSIFKDRQLSGADVKCKISNLTIEYRKKKKEQGKTGGSPSSWSYFDAIDKILGEFEF